MPIVGQPAFGLTGNREALTEGVHAGTAIAANRLRSRQITLDEIEEAARQQEEMRRFGLDQAKFDFDSRVDAEARQALGVKATELGMLPTLPDGSVDPIVLEKWQQLPTTLQGQLINAKVEQGHKQSFAGFVDNLKTQAAVKLSMAKITGLQNMMAKGVLTPEKAAPLIEAEMARMDPATRTAVFKAIAEQQEQKQANEAGVAMGMTPEDVKAVGPRGVQDLARKRAEESMTFKQDVDDFMMTHPETRDRATAEAFVRQRRRSFANQEGANVSGRQPVKVDANREKEIEARVDRLKTELDGLRDDYRDASDAERAKLAPVMRATRGRLQAAQRDRENLYSDAARASGPAAPAAAAPARAEAPAPAPAAAAPEVTDEQIAELMTANPNATDEQLAELIRRLGER